MFHRRMEEDREKRLKHVGRGRKGIKSPQNRSVKPQDTAGRSGKGGGGANQEPPSVPRQGRTPQGMPKVTLSASPPNKKSPILPLGPRGKKPRGPPEEQREGSATALVERKYQQNRWKKKAGGVWGGKKNACRFPSGKETSPPSYPAGSTLRGKTAGKCCKAVIGTVRSTHETALETTGERCQAKAEAVGGGFKTSEATKPEKFLP